MESHIEALIRRKVTVIQQEKSYDFPFFLIALREAHCRNRNEVCRDTKIGYDRLYRLEEGNFKSCMFSQVEDLADYFGVDRKLLVEKCRIFLLEKRKAK